MANISYPQLVHNIGVAIKEKAGLDSLKYGKMAQAIEDMGSGYPINVTFMDGENEYAKVGVSSSDVKVNAPDTTPPVPQGKAGFKGWGVGASTDVEVFPKSYSEDTILNAVFAASYVDDLYQFYNIDKNTFPYVFIQIRIDIAGSKTTTIHFATTYTQYGTYIFLPSYEHKILDNGMGGVNLSADVDYMNLTDVINAIKTLAPSTTPFKFSSSSKKIGENTNVYAYGSVPATEITTTGEYHDL